MAPVTTILFDCDNTLVLSEEIAFEACADLINTICAELNVTLPAPFTGESLFTEFVGQNFRGMLNSLKTRYNLEISDAQMEDYVKREEGAVIAKIETSLKPCVGVDHQLALLAAAGEKELSVVSSSAKRRVLASIKKVGQDKYFPDDKVFSAATSLPKPTSKPDPAVYLFALETLGKTAGECVAVEDSKTGTTSANRAGIRVIGYTGPYPADEKEKMAKVLTEAGANVIMDHWDQFPSMLADIQAL
ncbi:hypothetical protein BROUX41_002068 [Berkeleyomyces rouxiae]|uniref:uncharacterized protein n=1 Tax=Berkeleyomyces rouxiae TaxID=2035830 RepID=UPI003B802F72